ncbi:MAG: protease complex subunit PrcB family protein [Gammaproteobacteria bacterium]|nr:protease complex subunit PrcB family protein [Gammaproteobacteria bacterium]
MRILTFLLIIFSPFYLVACGSNPKKSDPDKVTQIYSGFHCGSQSRSAYVEWVDDSMLLERAFAKLSNQFSTARTPPPAVDFSRERIVIIHMGQMPTAGYSLRLASDALIIRKQTVELNMEWAKPQRGMMSAQIITNPCAVIKIPVADYKRLQVVDADGEARLKIDVQ